MDVTGAGPGASVLGNALQRGFGHTLYADHVRSLCGMEAVLPNGDMINTGFGRFENAKATRQFPYGLGPLLDGLFTQSNLGVVTAMGLWLQPRPADFRFFWIKVKDPAALAPLVNALRPLRLQGYLQRPAYRQRPARHQRRPPLPLDRGQRPDAPPPRLTHLPAQEHRLRRLERLGLARRFACGGGRRHAKASPRRCRLGASHLPERYTPLPPEARKFSLRTHEPRPRPATGHSGAGGKL